MIINIRNILFLFSKVEDAFDKMDDFQLRWRFVLARYEYVHMSLLLLFISTIRPHRYAIEESLLEEVRGNLSKCSCFSLNFLVWGQ